MRGKKGDEAFKSLPKGSRDRINMIDPIQAANQWRREANFPDAFARRLINIYIYVVCILYIVNRTIAALRFGYLLHIW